MAGVFISYRRVDSEGSVGRLSDHLRHVLGQNHVFLDVESIRPGHDFVKAVEESLSSCQAVLVVIGPQWLSAADDSGNRRLADASDLVRVEVRTALDLGILVIPVLVQKAKMPHADQLPRDLARLASCNAIEVSHERFSYDCDRIIEALPAFLSSGLIKVVRADQTLGKLMLANVHLDEKEVGTIMPGESIELGMAAGEHSIYVKSSGLLSSFKSNNSDKLTFRLGRKETMQLTVRVKAHGFMGMNQFVIERE